MREKPENKTLEHVAIIMDGNYRWAKSKFLPLATGHQKGANNIENIVKTAIEYKIKYLTLYAFSSENWDRPKEEVEYLMDLLDKYLDKDLKDIAKNDVKIIVSGNFDKVRKESQEKIAQIIEKTKDNKSLTLNIAFSYGSRQEITDTFKKLFLAVKAESTNIDDIKYEDIVKYFYQPDLPDPDLLIRTGGDKRISNFLLLQMAYTELHFTDVLWPDFSKKDLELALTDFNKKVRNYGKRQ